MAARTRRVGHDDATRQKIQTSQLINRLQANAMGEIELTQGQIKSIEVLLKKSLPDLSSIEVSGDGDKPIVNEIRMVVVDSGN
jgi:hypothetical protein